MYALYGIRQDYYQHKIGGSFESEDVIDLVALFTTEEKAKAYLEKSKLKNQERRHAFGQPKTFRKNSLLRYYDYAEIKKHLMPIDPVVDPEI